MFIRQLDRAAIKREARELMHTARVSPIRITLLFFAISFLLSLLDGAVTPLTGRLIGFASLSISFVSILITLLSQVLEAGYRCYTLGVHRREEMPCESLFDGFTFAGKIVALYIIRSFFIALWSMLFIIPGIIAAYRYSFAMLNLCENPELGVMEALNLSKQQTNGYKMQLFLLQLSFIGYQIAAVLIALLYEYVIISYLPDSLSGAVLGALIYGVLSAVVDVYLTPYLNLSTCRFYQLATAPQVNEPPHFDSWNDNF